MPHFEVVNKYIDKDINLPKRSTLYSAGYDFEVAEDTVVPSFINLNQTMVWDRASNHGEIRPLTFQEMTDLTKRLNCRPTLVPTGIKCKVESNQYLELSVRSSCPLKSWLILANGVGIIDADYYDNPDNEGHIYFQIINLSPFDIKLFKGDKIGQGIIKTYDVIDNDDANGLRTGGFGSTSNSEDQLTIDDLLKRAIK